MARFVTVSHLNIFSTLLECCLEWLWVVQTATGILIPSLLFKAFILDVSFWAVYWLHWSALHPHISCISSGVCLSCPGLHGLPPFICSPKCVFAVQWHWQWHRGCLRRLEKMHFVFTPMWSVKIHFGLCTTLCSIIYFSVTIYCFEVCMCCEICVKTWKLINTFKNTHFD